jgi:hypothetical protein
MISRGALFYRKEQQTTRVLLGEANRGNGRCVSAFRFPRAGGLGVGSFWGMARRLARHPYLLHRRHVRVPVRFDS